LLDYRTAREVTVKTDDSEKILRFITEMPKVELHLHLEGAIPIKTLYDLYRKKEGKPSITNLNDFRKKFDYTDFANFIDVWTWKNTFIQQVSDFDEITYQVLKELSVQNVTYVEAFYAPGDYWRQGFSIREITENIINGKTRAFRELGIHCELIIDLIRDHGPERSMHYLEAVTPFLGKGVIGIGLGGSEQLFPTGPYAPLYHEARERGFRLTAHAGEVAGPDSIWAAIDTLGSERIGHGTRAYEDPNLVSCLKERQIPLEMCVISNVRTQVCTSVDDHPIRQYFDRGLMVTVNSDDPTMFNTSITNEFRVLYQKLGFSIDEIKVLTMNAIKSSFLSDMKKASLQLQIEKEWKELLGEFPPKAHT
jgi:adenosine deaminase